MSYSVRSFLKSTTANRGAVPVADDNPLPVYQAGPPPATGIPGALSLRVMSAATTNATSVKASPGVVRQVILSNTGSVAYFKLYNKATAPTVGTDTPLATYAIPAGGVLNFNPPGGKFFSAGIASAITGLAPDADTTAVGLNQVTGSIEYL